MKVGIMSMQRVVNYGSFLQAYGLKAVIEEWGHTVEFVDYLAEPSLIQEKPATDGHSEKSIIRRLFRMLSPSYRDYRAKQIRLNKSFEEFSNAYEETFLPQLGITKKKNYLPVLDLLVIGSDEVFNCTQPGDLVGYSLQLFGKDHRAKKLISYAASFGSTTLEKIEQYHISDEIVRYLGCFDALSVRDGNSSQIISKLCGKIPEQHIDPVLLYDFPEVNEILISMHDYMVVYAYAGRIKEEEAEEIRNFAKKYHKKILSLGFYQPFADEFVMASPIEALAYIKHADYVVTDTFHGTVFSIKYQVPFATIVRDSNHQKLKDLLSKFQLSTRSVDNMNMLEKVLNTSIDQATVSTQIKEYQKKARTYLEKYLGKHLSYS
jgi:hypothetical protein